MDGPSPPNSLCVLPDFRKSKVDLIWFQKWWERSWCIQIIQQCWEIPDFGRPADGGTMYWRPRLKRYYIYIYLFQGNKMKQDWRKYFDDFGALCVCVCMFSCVVCFCHVSIFFHPILDLVEISLIASQHWIWNRRKLYSSYLQQKGYPLIRLWVLTVAHMIWETRFLL